MYGTRDAAQNWAASYVGFMISVGFLRGKASPCCFWHKDKGVRCVVQGDDFTVLGHSEQLDWFRSQIKAKYPVKFRGRLGPKKDDKSIRLLNRIITWDEEGKTCDGH